MTTATARRPDTTSKRETGARAVQRRLAAALLAALVSLPTAAGAADRIILISWDGIRREVLDELLAWQGGGEAPQPCPSKRHTPVTPSPCDGNLTCLPNICQFQIIDSSVIDGKPLTRPQHAQILTGYGAAATGQTKNSSKAAVPPGMTIYERIKQTRPEVMTVHIGGRKFVGRGITRYARRQGGIDLDLPRGSRDRYTGSATTERVDQALDLIGDQPFFMFVHYKAADVVGHRGGHKKSPYREAIIHNDIQVGALLDLLFARGLSAGTEVYITTDHGFDGVFHVNPNDPFVTDTFIASRTWNLAEVPASPQHIVPTILESLGIPLDLWTPPYPKHSLLLGPIP